VNVYEIEDSSKPFVVKMSLYKSGLTLWRGSVNLGDWALVFYVDSGASLLKVCYESPETSKEQLSEVFNDPGFPVTITKDSATVDITLSFAALASSPIVTVTSPGLLSTPVAFLYTKWGTSRKVWPADERTGLWALSGLVPVSSLTTPLSRWHDEQQKTLMASATWTLTHWTATFPTATSDSGAGSSTPSDLLVRTFTKEGTPVGSLLDMQTREIVSATNDKSVASTATIRLRPPSALGSTSEIDAYVSSFSLGSPLRLAAKLATTDSEATSTSYWFVESATYDRVGGHVTIIAQDLRGLLQDTTCDPLDLLGGTPQWYPSTLVSRIADIVLVGPVADRSHGIAGISTHAQTGSLEYPARPNVWAVVLWAPDSTNEKLAPFPLIVSDGTGDRLFYAGVGYIPSTMTLLDAITYHLALTGSSLVPGTDGALHVSVATPGTAKPSDYSINYGMLRDSLGVKAFVPNVFSDAKVHDYRLRSASNQYTSADATLLPTGGTVVFQQDTCTAAGLCAVKRGEAMTASPSVGWLGFPHSTQTLRSLTYDADIYADVLSSLGTASVTIYRPTMQDYVSQSVAVGGARLYDNPLLVVTSSVSAVLAGVCRDFGNLYTFDIRDDPSLEAGMTVQLQVDTTYKNVLITEVDRTFNGGATATVTAVLLADTGVKVIPDSIALSGTFEWRTGDGSPSVDIHLVPDDTALVAAGVSPGSVVVRLYEDGTLVDSGTPMTMRGANVPLAYDGRAGFSVELLVGGVSKAKVALMRSAQHSARSDALASPTADWNDTLNDWKA